jgi:hypothetical protein
MSYRRILYLGQFVAAVALPIWVLVSRGLLADGVGWQFLVYLIACPFLSIAMLAVGGLVSARRSVRLQRAVSWPDAALLSLWYLAIIAYGLWASVGLAVAVVVLGVALFWVGIWLLFTETRARFRGLVADFEEASRPSSGPSLGSEPRRIIVINPEDPEGKP